MSPADDATDSSLIATTARLRQLIHDLRCSAGVPAETLARVAQQLHTAQAALAPYVRQGAGWSTISVAEHVPVSQWCEDDLTAVMPFSPVTGRRNALAPPLRLWRAGDEVHGEVTFSPVYAGPPDTVHGGIIAAVFDELLSMANVISGTAGFTGSLTIKYHRKTPLNSLIELWAKNIRQDGRKQVSRGEMRVDGEVTASAEGLFIGSAELVGGGQKQ